MVIHPQIEKNFGKEAAALAYKGQLEARDEIARNCTELNIPGYEGPIDSYLFAEPDMDHSEIRHEYEALLHCRAGAGQGELALLPEKTSIGLPWIPDLALKISGNAQFDSHRYCQGLARAIHGNGSGTQDQCH